MFRARSGFWRRVCEVASDRIASAAVVEASGPESGRVEHHIQIVLATNGWFARDVEPIQLGITGWSPVVMLAICRFITPGFARETYLLKTTLPRRPWPRRRRR